MRTLLVAFMLISIVSCKKEDTKTPIDEREKFVGTYKGNTNITIPDPDIDINETFPNTFSITKSSTNPKQLIVDGEIANVSGSSFTFNEFTYTEEDPDLGTVIYIFNGIGSLSGSNLVQSGTVKAIIEGITYNGTWSSNSVKQ